MNDDEKLVPDNDLDAPWYEEPPPRPRSFITNDHYVASTITFGVFAMLTVGVQWLTRTEWIHTSFVCAMIVFLLLTEWERRARYLFGREHRRAHFDEINMLKITPPYGHVQKPFDLEPPTPAHPEQEGQRMDEDAILKHAQRTITGEKKTEGMESALEAALIKVLTKMVANESKPTTKPPDSDEKS